MRHDRVPVPGVVGRGSPEGTDPPPRRRRELREVDEVAGDAGGASAGPGAGAGGEDRSQRHGGWTVNQSAGGQEDTVRYGEGKHSPARVVMKDEIVAQRSDSDLQH